MKRKILQTDWNVCIIEANNYSSTAIAARIATNASWLKLWDMALDHGPHGTNCLQALYRELTRPQFQKGVCHLCDTVFNSPYFHHLIYSLTHTSLQPRVVNLLSFICWPRHFHVWKFLSNSYFIYLQCHCWLTLHKILLLLLTFGAHAQRGLQYLVCHSVCLSVCLSVRLSVTTFSAATLNKTANKRY